MFSTLTKRERFLIISTLEIVIDMIIENREGFDEYARHFNITQGRLNSYLSVLALGEFDKIIKTLSDASYRELTEIINHQSNHYDKLLRENDKIESIFSRLGSA